MSSEQRTPLMRRREAMVAFGGLGLGAIWQLTRGGVPAQAADCILAPEQTEGPYWLSNAPKRRDVRAGRPGTPLLLQLKVLNASTCKPIKGATVEIWHADAGGHYSGVEGSTGTRFLRGQVKSGADGIARFTTIFPGWYSGRTPHIHVKVHVGGQEVHTGQLYFSEAVQRSVYKLKAYASRGQADTTHAEDNIYRSGGSRSTLRLRNAATSPVTSESCRSACRPSAGQPPIIACTFFISTASVAFSSSLGLNCRISLPGSLLTGM